MDDLVTVTTFPDVPEAELARDRLKLEGVTAFVLSAQTTGVMPFLTASSGGVRVQVKREDLAKAKEILGT
jgi:putative signal transducing protein